MIPVPVERDLGPGLLPAGPLPAPSTNSRLYRDIPRSRHVGLGEVLGAVHFLC